MGKSASFDVIEQKMTKTIREICIILCVATAVAFAVNTISPAGIPLLGQWDESKGVVRADPNDEMANLGLEIDRVDIAKKIYDSGNALFVDARTEEAYDEGHVKGAVSLPWAEFDSKAETFLNQYPPDQTTIIYCSGRTCQDSHHLAEMLMELGYDRISIMIDGFPGWLEKGYPVE